MNHFFTAISALTLIIASAPQADAQSTSATESKLKSHFGTTDWSQMDAEQKAFWNFYLTDGFVIFDVTKNRAKSDIGHLDFEGDVSSIDPLAMGLKPQPTAVQTFELGSTGKGLMILSEEKIKAKMARK